MKCVKVPLKQLNDTRIKLMAKRTNEYGITELKPKVNSDIFQSMKMSTRL